jgi:hypothetical protein
MLASGMTTWGIGCPVQVPAAVVRKHPQYERLLGVLRKKVGMGKMRARQLANSLWALAKLAHEDEEDITAITRAMEGVRARPDFDLNNHIPSSFVLSSYLLITASASGHAAKRRKQRCRGSKGHCHTSHLLLAKDGSHGVICWAANR